MLRAPAVAPLQGSGVIPESRECQPLQNPLQDFVVAILVLEMKQPLLMQLRPGEAKRQVALSLVVQVTRQVSMTCRS